MGDSAEILREWAPYAVLIVPIAIFVIVDLYVNFVRRIPASKNLEKPGAAFPDGFLWGTGEDAYQHEGNSTNNEWHNWVHMDPSPIKNGAKHGRGTNFYELWREDFQRAKDDGHNAHRFGVEWSRLEPQEGVYDEVAWAKYEQMIRTAKEELGFTTFLNLWHFTLPIWAAEQGGWENPALMARWEKYVEQCAHRFGPWVDHWSTMIDSQIYALGGYFSGEIPPCVKNAKRAVKVYETMIVAHARAYRVLHAHDVVDARGLPKTASVGQIYFFLDFHQRGLVIDPVIRAQLEKMFNWSYLDALATGDIDIRLPLTPGVKRHDESLKGTLDWLGVNYFTRAVVSFNPFHPGFISRARQTPHPVSDMEWEIFPEGIHRTLTAVGARYQGLPLVVTECGLADEKDDRRPQFIVDHVAWAHQAMEEGVPLKGFFYWSMTDNWEWAMGDHPRFGLYRVDYTTCDRHRTKSAGVFSFLARKNRLPHVDEDPIDDDLQIDDMDAQRRASSG